MMMSSSVHANIARFHAFMYTEEGKKFMDRLWNETLKELEFPKAYIDGKSP